MLRFKMARMNLYIILTYRAEDPGFELHSWVCELSFIDHIPEKKRIEVP